VRAQIEIGYNAIPSTTSYEGAMMVDRQVWQ